MVINLKRLDHIQIYVLSNKEKEAKLFYIELLGLKEIPKPEYLKPNGGFCLEIADIELHIGLEEDQVHPSKKHPAIEVENLKAIKKHFLKNKIKIKEDKPIPDFKRFSFYDPFGSRIELLEKYEE